eukprot:3489785-Amphidinium_carterae.1
MAQFCVWAGVSPLCVCVCVREPHGQLEVVFGWRLAAVPELLGWRRAADSLCLSDTGTERFNLFGNCMAC